MILLKLLENAFLLVATRDLWLFHNSLQNATKFLDYSLLKLVLLLHFSW